MDTAELEVALEELEIRLERLRALYEQYFMGIERIEPSVARKDVDRRIYVLRREKIRNTAKRFKLQTIIQRYNTFQQYWQRICREIENGTYKRHLLKAQKNGELLTIAARRRLGRQASQPPGPAPSQPPVHSPEAAPVLTSSASSKPPPPAVLPPPAPAKFESLDLDMDFMGEWDPLAKRDPPKPTAPAAKRGSATVGSAEPNRAPAPAASAARPASVAPPPVVVPPRPASSRPPAVAAPRVPPSPRLPSAAEATRAAPPKPALPPPAKPALAPPKPALAPAAPPKPALTPPTPLKPPLAPAAPPKPAPLKPAPAPAPRANKPAEAPAAVAKPVAKTPQAAPAAPQPAATAASVDDTRLRDLHARLQQAKQQTKEGAVSFEGLAKSIRATEAKLREQHKNRKIDFDVVIKDGKAVVKPIVR